MMKRSEINRHLAGAIDFCRQHHFGLPPFAFWSPQEWQDKGHEYDEIRDCMLGWDVTDFGSSDFAHVGLALFTLRNGNLELRRYAKRYCQKVLLVGENQYTPYHFHFVKMEDIICQAAADLLVQVYNSDAQEGLADTPVAVMTDGYWHEVPAGTVVRLHPGESITLPPYQYHQFWAEGGMALVVEVSAVNNDLTDNRFLEEIGRFPGIEEDEPPLHLLCTEYPPAR
jgi:D-lyxose ketol-isomerase